MLRARPEHTKIHSRQPRLFRLRIPRRPTVRRGPMQRNCMQAQQILRWASRTATTPRQRPTEAARRLARYTEEVQQMRRSPLLSNPPKQKPPARRLPIQTRSTRIAAQKLAHIPASKRGEMLLMQRMGVPPPPAPVTPASKRALEAIFTDNLTETQIVALDELFPAANCKAGRAPRCAALVVA